MIDPAAQLLLAELRRRIAFGYGLQAAACLTAAWCLYVAIDTFLLGHPFMSALNTAVAFWNSETFASARRGNARLRDVKRKLIEAMRCGRC